MLARKQKTQIHVFGRKRKQENMDVLKSTICWLICPGGEGEELTDERVKGERIRVIRSHHRETHPGPSVGSNLKHWFSQQLKCRLLLWLRNPAILNRDHITKASPTPETMKCGFWNPQMIHTHVNSLLQVVPVPWKPTLHWHVKLPSVSLQVAWLWQLWILSVHSSTSPGRQKKRTGQCQPWNSKKKLRRWRKGKCDSDDCGFCYAQDLR